MSVVRMAGRVWKFGCIAGVMGAVVALSSSVSFAQCAGGMGRGGMGGSMGSQSMSMGAMGGGMRQGGGGGRMMGQQGRGMGMQMGMMNMATNGQSFSGAQSNPFVGQVMQNQQAVRARVMQSQAQLAARHQRQTEGLRQQSQSRSIARAGQRPASSSSRSLSFGTGS